MRLFVYGTPNSIATPQSPGIASVPSTMCMYCMESRHERLSAGLGRWTRSRNAASMRAAMTPESTSSKNSRFVAW